MNRFDQALKNIDEHGETGCLYEIGSSAVKDALTACASGVYKIKPIVFYSSECEGLCAEMVLGWVWCFVEEERDENSYPNFLSSHGEKVFFGKTLDEAKAAAEKWYKEKLMQALEEIV